MILVFDLDNTLFDESSYVYSGFRAVARHISKVYHKNSRLTLKRLCDAEQKMGRGKVFDHVLHDIGIQSTTAVRECLSVYRLHSPNIKLNQDADACLKRFAHLPLYVVTDGNKIVQRKKIGALQLSDRIKHAFITQHYGLRYAKPSPFCFLKICEREKVSPNKVIYIGDNPHKDFVGIKPLGFRTIRLLQGPYAATEVPLLYDAHLTIRSLNQVTQTFLNRLAGA